MKPTGVTRYATHARKSKPELLLVGQSSLTHADGATGAAAVAPSLHFLCNDGSHNGPAECRIPWPSSAPRTKTSKSTTATQDFPQHTLISLHIYDTYYIFHTAIFFFMSSPHMRTPGMALLSSSSSFRLHVRQ